MLLATAGPEADSGLGGVAATWPLAARGASRSGRLL